MFLTFLVEFSQKTSFRGNRMANLESNLNGYVTAELDLLLEVALLKR